MSGTKHVVDLGPRAELAPLFSYPANCHEVCFLPQTLEDTIRLYIRASLDRDLFHASSVAVRANGDRILAEISGDAAAPYANMLPRFLAAGALGLTASRQLNADNKWRYNWRFLLPLGLPMVRHRTVQLLHFPPDYVLSRDQDYLAAHTTTRWAELLTVNGVAATDTSLYQNIVDIAPIAAPSDDGRNLEGVYAYYTDYITGLLRLWLPTSTKAVRPMVAFGSPVRDWLKTHGHASLKVMAVGTATVAGDLQAPTLAANHPSFIYNAAERLSDDPKTAEDERLPVLAHIMREDLIAANWQVLMGATPEADPKATLDACAARWTDAARQQDIYDLTRQQVLQKTPQTSRLALRFPQPSATFLSLTHEPAQRKRLDDKVAALREELGALDGREPHDIVA